MDPFSVEALARIWADATPLDAFVEKKAEQLCGVTVAPATMEPRRDVQPSGIERYSTVERLALWSQVQTSLMAARAQATRDTSNELVAGRLVGLGRMSTSYAIEVIEASFWIGAAIAGDTASRDGRKMIDIRIVLPETIPSFQPKPQSRGKPSEGDVIKAAILDWAKTDPALRRPPLVRYKAYRAFIVSQRRDPKDPGFDEKTFQKYETEFRKGKLKS
ncbi:MAG TPA: hypothetical protein VMU40_22285 [Steroidobacteraceae bacterium]|nr:hypothetical protein [Steroidobacteraceae bacterium]